MPVNDFDPIEQSPRYILGETHSSYGVWDKRGGTELVEEFPLTDQGFERALDRYSDLKRWHRAERGFLLYALWLVILLGVLMSVVGGVLEILAFAFEFESLVATNLVFTFSSIAYNVMIGGLALLGGLTLIRRETRRRADPTSEVPELMAPEPLTVSASSFIWWILVIALGVWILSSIATQFLYPLQFDFGDRPGNASRMAMTVESLAFRVWVGALAIIWARWLLAPRMTGQAEAAE